LTKNIPIPDTVSQGNYYLGMIIDQGGFITESNEDNNTKASSITYSIQSESVEMHFTFTDNTGSSYSIVIDDIKLLGVNIASGDEVGIFTSADSCVGATQYEGTLPLGITAWANNSQTQQTDGYTTGDTMYFKVWDNSLQRELTNTTAIYSIGNGKFGTGAYAQISKLNAYGYFKFTSNTGTSYSIVIDSIAYDSLSIGDEIGVFDNDLCVGAVIFDGNYPVGLTAWGNNAQTAQKDGYSNGSSITFKLYDSSSEDILTGSADYSSGDGNFGTGSLAKLILTISTTVTQTIALNSGWNLISSYVSPTFPSIDEMTQSISSSLSIIQNDAGKFYIPGVFNGIGEFNIYEAYWIYMSESANLDIPGSLIPLSTPIPLSAGWNYVPNYNTTTTAISTQVTSLGTHLVIVQNDAGKFYIPGTIDLIGNLEPGKGYTMYLSEADTLLYQSQQSKPVLGKFCDLLQYYSFKSNTGGSYSIVIYDVKIAGNTLENGDEIGVFDVTSSNEIICVGAIAYNGIFPLGLVAWIDDSQTTEQDGFLSGDSMMFKIFDHSEKKEYHTSALYTSGNGTFGYGAFSIISTLNTTNPTSVENKRNEIISDFKLLGNYPNPFNPETTIKYQLPEPSFVRLVIYNIQGQEIKTLVNEKKSSGYHSVRWNGTNNPGIKVNSGVYLYHLQAGKFSDVKKMLLLK